MLALLITPVTAIGIAIAGVALPANADETSTTEQTQSQRAQGQQDQTAQQGTSTGDTETGDSSTGDESTQDAQQSSDAQTTPPAGDSSGTTSSDSTGGNGTSDSTGSSDGTGTPGGSGASGDDQGTSITKTTTPAPQKLKANTDRSEKWESQDDPAAGGMATFAATGCADLLHACLTIDKDVEGGSASASDWSFTAQGQFWFFGWHDFESPVEFSSGQTKSVLAVWLGVNLIRYQLDESAGPDGYTQTGLTCDGGGLDGENVTVSPLSSVTCTFTNTYVDPTVTVQKNWTDGIQGDTADLSVGVVDGPSASATSTSNGQAGTWVDTTNTATLRVSGGSSIQVSEALGDGNAGDYTANLTCENAEGETIDTDGGAFTIPEATPASDITCTFTNGNDTATLTVVKSWVDGVSGDTATLTADIAGDDYDPAWTTSTSNGNAGTWTDPDNAIVIQVPVGKSVALSEALGQDDVGDYTGDLTCESADPDGNGMITVLDNDPVMCTFTNTNATSTLTLTKAWMNGVSGDTATMTVGIAGDRWIPISITSTSNGDAGSWTNPDNALVVEVPIGKSVALSEALGQDDAGAYTGVLTCDGADPDGNGMIANMPGDPVQCTFTNTNDTQILTLQKTWVDGVAGDTADMTVAVAGDGYEPVMATSTSNGKKGSWTDADHTVTATVPVGKSVSLTEALGGKDASDYTGVLTCDGAKPGMNGMFDMPAAAVTCTFTNTHATPLIPIKPASLPSTGSSVPVVGLFGGAAGLIALGALALFLMWRRRRNGLAE